MAGAAATEGSLEGGPASGSLEDGAASGAVGKGTATRGAGLMTIGELARRTGLSVSAIRFYEAKGLVASVRTRGNQRRFLRADIRRLSFALIAQQLGLSLSEIQAVLAGLPHQRTPNRADWQAISRRMRTALDARIALLSATRDRLDGCIGCGCLSLDHCALYNPGDRAAHAGAGPRYLLGDSASDFEGE